MTKSVKVDVVVIGGGVLGCFTARALRRFKLHTLLLEAANDVCMGISRANCGIVYAGYDNTVESLKGAMTVTSNASFERLCAQLKVPFKRCGGMMVCHGPHGQAILEKKYAQGCALKVPGLQILDAQAAHHIEPALSDTVTGALFAPSVGTVNPWQLTIAAYENALANGAEAMLGTSVTAIRCEAQGYVVNANDVCIRCRAVINCAGLSADHVHELCFPPSVRLRLDGADYLVMAQAAENPSHVIFQEREEGGKGVTVVPTVEGTLLVESPARPLEAEPWATSRSQLKQLQQFAAALLPAFSIERCLRSFAAVRPNPYDAADPKHCIQDFMILEPAPGFISLMGIKTPGLTCANALAQRVSDRIACRLQAPRNKDYDPYRRVQEIVDDEIICQCHHVSKAAILAAIARGATSIDGVKHRLGTGMGPCQGGRCQNRIEALIEEYGHGTL